MRKLIDQVGDRLLAVLMPKVTAAACVFPDCHYEFLCNANHHLSRRQCCRDPECILHCTPFSQLDDTHC